MSRNPGLGFIATIILVVAITLMGCLATENSLPEINTSGQAIPVDRNLYHMAFTITATPALSPVESLPSPTQTLIAVTPGFWTISPLPGT
jgi:uncharacterized membrane protein YhhN